MVQAWKTQNRSDRSLFQGVGRSSRLACTSRALGPLLADHGTVQVRVSNPATTLFRKLGLAVQAAGHLEQEYTASDLCTVCNDANIEIPRLMFNDCNHAAKVMGALMAKLLVSVTLSRSRRSKCTGTGAMHQGVVDNIPGVFIGSPLLALRPPTGPERRSHVAPPQHKG